MATTLLQENFQTFQPAREETGTNIRWRFFRAAPGDFADDGIATTGNGLLIRSTPFTETRDTYLDHVKYLVLSEQGFPVGTNAEIRYTVRLSVATCGVENHPFGCAVRDPQDDLRLATAAINFIDFQHAMVFDFLITNKSIYALYERLPSATGENYHAFTHAIYLGGRNHYQPSNDYMTLSIGYRRATNSVHWYINGLDVFHVTRIGMPIDPLYRIIDKGGVPEEVFPAAFNVGFGTFTLLDAHMPHNYNGEPTKALVRLDDDTYLNPLDLVNGHRRPSRFVGGPKLFGQGVAMHLLNLRVESFATFEDAINPDFNNQVG